MADDKPEEKYAIELTVVEWAVVATAVALYGMTGEDKDVRKIAVGAGRTIVDESIKHLEEKLDHRPD